MPGRWVGGRGSQASPTKDQLIEGKVTDEEGNSDGTVLIKVKRIYAPGEKGRFILGDYISASSKGYRDWAASKMGRVSTIDGSYHLCRGHPESCTAAGQNDVTVHIGQWRLWKESELLAEAPEGYGRDAKNLLTQYFKRHDLEKGRGDESGLAWKPPGRQGVLNIGGGSKSKPAEPKKTEPAPAAEVTATKAAQIKDLRQQLKELKASLKKDEEAGGTRKKRKEPPAGEKEDRERKKKKGKPFSGAGVTGEKDVDWGDRSPEGDDSPSDDSDEEEESEEEESSETAAKKARRKKKPAKKSRGKKKKGSKKKKGKEKKRLQSDKGPFGVGEERKVPKEGSDSGKDEPGESSESSQSFRKAPSGLTLHLRLQRYAQRHPGRLATRLLQKMERATRFEGAMPLRGKPPGNEVKPSALSYYLAILTPALKDRWNIRTQRELRVLVEILDQMAIENGPGAADIVAQRIKALEQSVLDNNTWKKAKFLELTAEEASLADKGEEQMMVKEAELEDRLKTRSSWGGHWDDGRNPFRGKDGKGTGKTKGKEKGKPKTPAQERFISIFVPLNSVSKKIEGDEATLPYVGQVNLLQIPDESEIVIDSEDMASAFNLFKMPIGWRGLFVYEKTAPACCFGKEGNAPTYVALRTVPMGWLSAVGLVQAAIRHLAFNIAGLPGAAEVQKWKKMPRENKLLLYLDSVDQLKLVSKALAKVIEGEESDEHRRFKKACESKGLPTNASKTLSGSLVGSLQGGELRSKDGTFSLHPDKQRMNLGMCLRLLGKEKWNFQLVAGTVGRLVFASAFRRCLLAFMDEFFVDHQQLRGEQTPSKGSVEELLTMACLMPLTFTNVRAPIFQKLSATDASPTGGGSCQATELKRPHGIPNPTNFVCTHCRSDMSEMIANGADIECPFGCGQRCCSLQCFLDHRDQCADQAKEVPLFSERWSGPNAPLSIACLQSGFDVILPFDKQVSEVMDIFTPQGQEVWEALDATEVEAEHHAPDCKSFSRARGRPFWVGDEWHRGPPALRSERHVLGLPNLQGHHAAQVRQGNRMAARSIKRCGQLDDNGKIFTLEHPWRSWRWYTKQAIELAARDGVFMAVFSNCCYGGRTQKWTALLTNSREVFEALHHPDCPHGLEYDYQPYYDEDHVLRYPTEEEAEYPEGLCQALAGALVSAVKNRNRWPDPTGFRVQQVEKELMKYPRFEDAELRRKVAARIASMEAELQTGQEDKALATLLDYGHYRGTDIRLTVEHNHLRELVPYPAYRWVWRDVLSFKWKQDAHINELESLALVAHIRRLLKDPAVLQTRLLVVVDSQVLYFALGKGRSPAKRLNKILKRLSALQLAADVYVLPIWTLSAWNFADNPSRRA
eukprot:Skav211631  [mRNA]  locus=scaffold2262:105332:110360:+ [translate_table: standard]